MNLQTLRYFVSLARTNSYTKAAQECYVSQPALSRSIAEFENEIGCHLVNRSSRSVQLTVEGEVCLEEAKKILKQCDTLIDKVTNAGRQCANPIRIGYIIYGHIGIFNERLSQIPNSNLIKIETEYDSLINTNRKLLSDEIDMAIMPEICVADTAFQKFRLVSSKLYVIVPCKNKLFQHNSISFHDLKDQRFIGWDPGEVPLLSDAHSKVCEANGFKPEFVTYAKKMGDLMTLSILHNALGFAACTSTIVNLREFKLIPVSDSETNFGLVCVWKKNNKNPFLNKLIKILGK